MPFMELALILAIFMILVAMTIIVGLLAIGHDMRSRGASDAGYVVATLYTNHVTVKDYVSRLGQHPVLAEKVKEAALSRALFVLTVVLLICSLVALIVTVITAFS
jgi:hypothetical protein